MCVCVCEIVIIEILISISISLVVFWFMVCYFFVWLLDENNKWGMISLRETFDVFWHMIATCYINRASLVAQRVKRLPTMWETWVRYLGPEDALEKEMATHSSIHAWKSHGPRSLVGYSPWGRKESDTAEPLHFTSYKQRYFKP